MLRFLNRIWIKRWLYTVLTVIAIFYLTLVPRPLPDDMSIDIPGMDKIVHACMFGGLTFVACFDYAYRRKRFVAMSGRTIAAIAIFSAIFGGAIEIAQQQMNMGRGGDIYDFLADIAGCVIAALIARHILTPTLPASPESELK